MPSLDQKQELVVWTEHRALDEAKSVFAQFDAAFQTVPCDSPSRLAKSPVFVFYLPNGEQEAAVERALNTFRSCKSSALVFSPHHTSHFAFRIGTMVGRKKLPEAEWAFNLQHLKQLLRDRNIAAHTRRKRDPTPSLDPAGNPEEAEPQPKAVGLGLERDAAHPPELGGRKRNKSGS
jgi:hypothetical protein